MDRPALQRLLADITAGRVEIVVYKIDRLSRSLAVAFVALAKQEGVSPPSARRSAPLPKRS
jgi:DNA invertase Pin-like site-specific DNA recombinase